MNKTELISKSLRWEILKALLRGEMTSLSSYNNDNKITEAFLIWLETDGLQGMITSNPVPIFRALVNWHYSILFYIPQTDQLIIEAQTSLSALRPDADTHLNKPITVEEIAVAIESVRSGRSNCPNGYGLEFYKKVYDDVRNPLNKAVSVHFSPRPLYLLMERDRDPTHFESYGSIGLNCNHYKSQERFSLGNCKPLLWFNLKTGQRNVYIFQNH